MKKSAAIIVWGMFLWCGQAAAQGFSFTFDGKNMQMSSQQATLYHFSEGLLDAVLNCRPYFEDFSANNPDIKKAGAFLGGADLSITVDVKGEDKGQCFFEVTNKLEGLSSTTYYCSVSEKQRKEIYEAMLDRSTQPVTESFETFSTVTTADGKVSKQPVQTTMTDSRFNVTWNKIKATACETEEKQPEAEEVNALQAKMNNFSDGFLENLKNCRPASESKNFLMFKTETTIVGGDFENCYLHYGNFELSVSRSELEKIKGIGDIQALIRDRKITRYNPEYDDEGLMFELANCQNLGKEHNNRQKMRSDNGMKITTGMSLAFDGKNCEVRFLNKLKADDGDEEDYSRVCLLPLYYVEDFLEPYKDLIRQYGVRQEDLGNGKIQYAAPRSNELTRAADKELKKKLLESGLCQ